MVVDRIWGEQIDAVIVAVAAVGFSVDEFVAAKCVAETAVVSPQA